MIHLVNVRRRQCRSYSRGSHTTACLRMQESTPSLTANRLNSTLLFRHPPTHAPTFPQRQHLKKSTLQLHGKNNGNESTEKRCIPCFAKHNPRQELPFQGPSKQQPERNTGRLSSLPCVTPGKHAKHDAHDRHQAKDALSAIECFHNCLHLSKCWTDTSNA